MNERQPETTEIDNRIDYLMDTLGISSLEARRRLGVPDDDDDDAPVFTRDESIRLHPSNAGSRLSPRPQRKYESRYDGDTFPVIDTTRMSDEQAITNAVGAAGVRAVMRTPDSELTAHQRAIDRAKEERRGRRQ